MKARTLVASVVASLVVAAAAVPAAAQARDVLPDLDQVAPTDVNVKRVLVGGSPAFHLGFSSATENRGRGPLTVHGFRRTRTTPLMQVDQFVRQSDGTERVVRDVGEMSYVYHPDHQHWHFLGFARYELRTLEGEPATVRSDRKTGFCLGDRYRVRGARSLPGFQPFPAQADECGFGQNRLLGLFAGISTGYGDRYLAHLEGQYVDVTGVPEGRYLLVHTVNPDRGLIESDYSDNSSSAAIKLAWPNGSDHLPTVQVRRRCDQTATCSLTTRTGRGG